MLGPAEQRVPVEIWQKILLEFISAQSLPVFATSCSSSDYLIFKRTCGDGMSTSHRYEYAKFQQNGRSIRGVCRSWKIFFDEWYQGDRWAYQPLTRGNNESPWANYSWRLDISGALVPPLTTILSEWKQMGSEGRYNTQLIRMEILDIKPDLFANLLRELCNVAPVLKNLRSLGLPIADRNYTIMEKLANRFPRLTHLTLRLHHVDHPLSSNDPLFEVRGSAMLKCLEVLFLFPGSRSFDLGEWNLPSLRHIHMRPADPLNSQAYQFLQRHAQTIETIDLDNTNGYHRIGKNIQVESTGIAFPLDFWDTFIHLKLLRCSSGRVQLERVPEQQHPIECFVLTDSIELAPQLRDVLRPWAKSPNIKTLKTIVLYGYFLTKGYHLCEKGELPRLMELLAKNGTRLINPAGKSWV